MSQDDPQNPMQPGQNPPPPSWSQPGSGATPPPAYTPPPAAPSAPAPGYTQPQGYPAPGAAPGYPQAPAYGQPAYGQAPAPSTPGIAIWGLVLAFLAAPVGLVVSLIALGKTKRAGKGKGLAIAGVILSIVSMVVGGLLIWAAFRVGGALVEPSVAVIDFNNAIDEGDCDAFVDNSTDAYRESMGVTDCDTFAQFVENTVAGLEDYSVSVTGMQTVNDVATVSTTETYTVTEDGSQGSDPYEYTLVQEDGSWKVDAVTYLGE